MKNLIYALLTSLGRTTHQLRPYKLVPAGVPYNISRPQTCHCYHKEWDTWYVAASMGWMIRDTGMFNKRKIQIIPHQRGLPWWHVMGEVLNRCKQYWKRLHLCRFWYESM